MIKFTVVTCTYNAERYCSVHSTASSGRLIAMSSISLSMACPRTIPWQLVKAYQHRNAVGENSHEIVVDSEPDKGLYDAMNKSIDSATGDYLVFLNAGDMFPTDDTLEYVEGCVGEGELLPGVLYGDTDIVNEMGASYVIVVSLHPRS